MDLENIHDIVPGGGVDGDDHDDDPNPADELDHEPQAPQAEVQAKDLGATTDALYKEGTRTATATSTQEAMAARFQDAYYEGGLATDAAVATMGIIELLTSVRGIDALLGTPESDFTQLMELTDCAGARLEHQMDMDTVFYSVRSLAQVTHCHPRPFGGRGVAPLDLQRLKFQLTLRGDGTVICDIRQRAPLGKGRRAQNHRDACAAYAEALLTPRSADEELACIPFYRVDYLGHHPGVDAPIFVADVALAFLPPSPAVWLTWNLFKEFHRVALQGFPEEGRTAVNGVRLRSLVASHAAAHPDGGKQFGPNDVRWESATPQLGPQQMRRWADRLRNVPFRAAFLKARQDRFRRGWTGTEAELQSHWAQMQTHFEALAAPGGVRYLVARQLHRQRTEDVFHDTADAAARARVAEAMAQKATTELLTGIDVAAELPEGWRQIQMFVTLGMEIDVVRGTGHDAPPFVREGAKWTDNGESRYVVVLDRAKVLGAVDHAAVQAAAGGRLRFLPSMGNMSSTAGPCGLMCAAGVPLGAETVLDPVGLARLIAGSLGPAGLELHAAMLFYTPITRRTMDPLHMLFDEPLVSRLAQAAVEGPPEAVEALTLHLEKLRQAMEHSVTNIDLEGPMRIERVAVITVESGPGVVAAVRAAVQAIAEALTGLRVEQLVGIMDGGAFKAFLGAYIDGGTGVAQHYVQRSGGAPQAVVFALAMQGIIMTIMEGFAPGRQLPWLANRMMRQVFVTAALRGWPFMGYELLCGPVGMEMHSEVAVERGSALLRMFDLECRIELIAHAGRRVMGAYGRGSTKSPAARLQLFSGAMTAAISRLHPSVWPHLWTTFKGAMLLITLYHSSLEAKGQVIIKREARGRFKVVAGALVACLKVVRAHEDADDDLMARFDCAEHRLELGGLLAGTNVENLQKLLALGLAKDAFSGEIRSPVDAASWAVCDLADRLRRADGVARRSHERSPVLSCVAGMVSALERLFPYDEDADFKALGPRGWALDLVHRLDTLSLYVAVRGRLPGSSALPLFTSKSWEQKRLDVGRVGPGPSEIRVSLEQDLRHRVRRTQRGFQQDAAQADPMVPRGLASCTSERAVERWEAAVASLVETAVKRVSGSALDGNDPLFSLRDVRFTRSDGVLRESVDHDGGDSVYSVDEELAAAEADVLSLQSTSGDEREDEEAEAAEEAFAEDEECTLSIGAPSACSGGSNLIRAAAEGLARGEEDEGEVAGGMGDEQEEEEHGGLVQGAAAAAVLAAAVAGVDADEAGPSAPPGERLLRRDRHAPEAFSPGADEGAGDKRGRQAGAAKKKRKPQAANRGRKRKSQRRK